MVSRNVSRVPLLLSLISPRRNRERSRLFPDFPKSLLPQSPYLHPQSGNHAGAKVFRTLVSVIGNGLLGWRLRRAICLEVFHSVSGVTSPD